MGHEERVETFLLYKLLEEVLRHLVVFLAGADLESASSAERAFLSEDNSYHPGMTPRMRSAISHASTDAKDRSAW